MDHVNHRPLCRNRQRVAEVPVNGKRRLCAEAYRNGNGDVVVVWPEVFKGRNWKQVGRAVPLSGQARTDRRRLLAVDWLTSADSPTDWTRRGVLTQSSLNF